jgi:hypothetical protein
MLRNQIDMRLGKDTHASWKGHSVLAIGQNSERIKSKLKAGFP